MDGKLRDGSGAIPSPPPCWLMSACPHSAHLHDGKCIEQNGLEKGRQQLRAKVFVAGGKLCVATITAAAADACLLPPHQVGLQVHSRCVLQHDQRVLGDRDTALIFLQYRCSQCQHFADHQLGRPGQLPDEVSPMMASTLATPPSSSSSSAADHARNCAHAHSK